MSGDGSSGPPRSAMAGDALLVLAGVALLVALAAPSIRWASFRHRLHTVEGSVDAVRSSAVRYHRLRGVWPAPAPAGTEPPELAGLLPGNVALAGTGYRLAWERWSAAERSPSPSAGRAEADSMDTAPPTVGTLAGITVRSPEGPLLAALLRHYGPATSFARDSSWTLIVRARDSATAARASADPRDR